MNYRFNYFKQFLISNLAALAEKNTAAIILVISIDFIISGLKNARS